MDINYADKCPPCGPMLKDLEPGDLFEIDCEEPKAVYLVVENHPDAVRASPQMRGPRYVSLTFNKIMKKTWRRPSSRVIKLCGAPLAVGRYEAPRRESYRDRTRDEG